MKKNYVCCDRPGFQDDELNTAYNIAEAQPDKDFTIVPVRLEDCGRGDFRFTSFQQYDLFKNFEEGLDRLAIDLGGISLSDAAAKDERTEDEKMVARLTGKAGAAYYAGDESEALELLNSTEAFNIKEEYKKLLKEERDTLEKYFKKTIKVPRTTL